MLYTLPSLFNIFKGFAGQDKIFTLSFFCVIFSLSTLKEGSSMKESGFTTVLLVALAALGAMLVAVLYSVGNDRPAVVGAEQTGEKHEAEEPEEVVVDVSPKIEDAIEVASIDNKFVYSTGLGGAGGQGEGEIWFNSLEEFQNVIPEEAPVFTATSHSKNTFVRTYTSTPPGSDYAYFYAETVDPGKGNLIKSLEENRLVIAKDRTLENILSGVFLAVVSLLVLGLLIAGGEKLYDY